MGYQNIIYSSTITDGSLNGPWIDIGSHIDWSIQIQNMSAFVAVEVSNQINAPYSYFGQIPGVLIPEYPPFKYPVTATEYTAEVHTVPSSAPYNVTVNNAPGGAISFQNVVVNLSGGSPPTNQALQYASYLNYPAARYVGGATGFLPEPGPGQYTVNPKTGVFTFNAASAGQAVAITYYGVAPASGVVITASEYFIPASASSGNALVISKPGLNVKWIRITNTSAGSGSPPVNTVVGFLHTA
jgi:hypothetical protein